MKIAEFIQEIQAAFSPAKAGEIQAAAKNYQEGGFICKIAWQTIRWNKGWTLDTGDHQYEDEESLQECLDKHNSDVESYDD